MLIPEEEVRQLLFEMFRKFKKDYPFLNPKSFIVGLAQMYGGEIPETSISKIKYNLMLDVLQEMYGKKHE